LASIEREIEDLEPIDAKVQRKANRYANLMISMGLLGLMG
jgi:hypothetical protein